MKSVAVPRSSEESCTAVCIESLGSLEQELTRRPLLEWPDVVAADPTATLFQCPDWTLAWYRAYRNDYTPRVLVVTAGGCLAGVVPLAVENRGGRICFACDQFADYRDVVARPGYRRQVVLEFLEFFRRGNHPNVLWLGPTLPESETAETALAVCAEAGVYAVRRSHFGWRWLLSERNNVEDPLKKKAVRYAINYFKRRGPVGVRVIDPLTEWDRVKDEFYDQHSLRQLYGGRKVSFDDVRKREFFDNLSRLPSFHVTALDVNGQMVAIHAGSVYRNLLQWGAPSFDIREKTYSPGLILMVLSMQAAESWGLNGIDLTIGEGDLKERFSTTRVILPSVELFSSRLRYIQRNLRVGANDWVRSRVIQIAGEGKWKQIQQAGRSAAHNFERFRELGLLQSIRRLGRRCIHVLGERATGLVLVATPESVRAAAPKLQPGDTLTIHEDRFTDLLRWKGEPGETADVIGWKAQQVPDLLKSGRTFHTVLVNDRLAAWGISYFPTEPAHLTESGGTVLEFQPNSVSLYDFYTIPEFRGRKLYQALLCHILRQRFEQGAERAYIGVLESNKSSLAAIERIGFRLYMVNRYWRLLRWKRMHSQTLNRDSK